MGKRGAKKHAARFVRLSSSRLRRPVGVMTVYLLIGLYTVAPLLSVLAALAIASATGSQLDEGGPHPAVVFGIDIGHALYTMFVLGWLSFFTIPTGLLALVAYTIVLLAWRGV